MSRSTPCYGGYYGSPCKRLTGFSGPSESVVVAPGGDSVYMATADRIVGWDREPLGRVAVAPRRIRLRVENTRLEKHERIEWSVQVHSPDPGCIGRQEVRVRVQHGPNGYGAFRSRRTDALGRASGSGPTFTDGKVLALLERDSTCAGARSNGVNVTVPRSR